MTKKIEFAKDYLFAHNGVHVVQYKAGDIVENPSEDLAQTAAADGVLKQEKVGAGKPKTAVTAPAETKPVAAE